MTYSAVEKAVDLVVNYYETRGIVCDTDSIRDRVLSWYNHSDVADAEILAGAALTGYWFSNATYDDMLLARNVFLSDELPMHFDNDNIYISVEEMKMADEDSRWW